MADYSLRTAQRSVDVLQEYLNRQSFLTEPPREYYEKLSLLYGDVCGDYLNAQSGLDGNILVQNLAAEGRFAQTLGSFFSSPMGKMTTYELAQAFGSHLDKGKGCPDGTPGNIAYANSQLGPVLIPGYKHESSILAFTISFFESHGVSDAVDDGWNDILEGRETETGSVPIAQGDDEKLLLLKGAKERIDLIIDGLNNKTFNSDELFVYQLLLNIIGDRARQRLGYKLLNLIELRDGRPVLPAGFNNLVYAADGGFVSPIFASMVDVISLTNGVPYDLIRTLMIRALMVPLSDARRHAIELAITKLAESKIDLAENLGRLLKDATEVQYMDAAPDWQTYWNRRTVRKNPRGQGGSGSQVPPASSVPSAPVPSGGQDASASSVAGLIQFYGVYNYALWSANTGIAFRRFPTNAYVPQQNMVWMMGAQTMVNNCFVQ